MSQPQYAKPAFILFDYGQTLIMETGFDGVKGNTALLEYAVENPDHLTGAQLRDVEERVRREMGIDDRAVRVTRPQEIHHHIFQRFFFEYLGIRLSIGPREAEQVYWDAAAPGTPAPGVGGMLAALWQKGVRTGVLSNLTFGESTLRARIDRLIPGNHFDFFMASSEYGIRKPSRMLFELALKKAGVPAERAWFCGDNFACDVEGSHQAGMVPVWYRDAEPPVPVGFEYLHIRHWDELRRMAEGWPD